jgi:hypothetical protein
MEDAIGPLIVKAFIKRRSLVVVSGNAGQALPGAGALLEEKGLPVSAYTLAIAVWTPSPRTGAGNHRNSMPRETP